MDYIFIESLTPNDRIVVADKSEQKHLDVLRIRHGDRVGVLNGKGLVATCVVNRVNGTPSLEIVATHIVAKPPSLTLVMGLLDNRDRWEFAIEKATELGVERIVPLVSDHVQNKRFSRERTQQKIIAALKQSGNAWLTSITEPVELNDMHSELQDFSHVILGDIEGGARSQISNAANVAVVVGPEGGFSAREIVQLKSLNNVVLWRISSNRLRSETAAISLVATAISQLDDAPNLYR